MTTILKQHPRRKLDVAGLILALVGIAAGVFAYNLVEAKGYDALLVVPSVVAFTLGISNITKLEAPRD